MPDATRPPNPAASLAAAAADRRRVAINAWRSDMVDTWVLTMMGNDFPPWLIGKPNIVEALGWDPEIRTRIEQIRDASLFGLTDGLLLAADEEMADLVDVAAASMPDQPLHETDMISPHGFVWFETSLPDRTGTQPELPVAAIAWITLSPDHPVVAGRGDNPEGAPVVLIHTYTRMSDMPGAPPADDPRLANKPNLYPSSSTAWVMGTLIGKVFGEAPPPGHYAPGFYQRITAAFWALAQQPLTATSHEPPGDKNTRKKSARVGIKHPHAPVHVVTLRRTNRSPREDGGEDTGRRVGVRFAVRGFWRNTWYPSKGLHRQQWIAPHWRGPEDAPVQGGERVFLASGKNRDV